MNVKLRMYDYCYSNLGAIYAKGLWRTVANSGDYWQIVANRSRWGTQNLGVNLAESSQQRGMGFSR